MRNWMAARSDSLHEISPLGSPVKTLAAGRIVESLDPRYPVGSRITAMSCWSEYDIIDTVSAPQIIADGISAVEALGPFGLNSLTAYFGLMRIGRPCPGDVLVVSGAAGSAGSVAAQLGRITGCRGTGIAGGAEKSAWLRDQGRSDDVIDYLLNTVIFALCALCPNRVDLFFVNFCED